jgi:hypothetical protein
LPEVPELPKSPKLKSKTKRQNLPQIYADERGSEEIARIAMIAKDRN